MKKLGIAVLKGALWITGIVVVLGGLIAFGNSFDEDLHPEAAEYLKPGAPSQLPDDRNAYFAVIGLGAPESEQPHAAGRKWVETVNGAVAKRLKGEDAAYPRAGTARAIAEICVPDKTSCLAAVLEKKAEARKLVIDNASLLERYRALDGYPGYAETMEYAELSQPFIPVLPLISAQRVFHADAALRVAQGEVDAVLADLEKEIAFLRRMLAGSNMLVSKMVAGRLLLRSVLMASDVMAQHREAAASRAAGLAQALGPLAAEERRLDAALRHEFRFQKRGFDNMLKYPELAGESWPTGWLRLFYAPDATANMEIPFRKAALDADAMSANALAGAKEQHVRAPSSPVWMDWYNPIGKLLVLPSLEGASFGMYIRQMHDLDGLVRLVGLQTGIVAKNVKDEDVPQFLAGAGKGYANPWTEKPILWDARSRQIYFEPGSKRYQENRIGGTAGRVAVTL